jgi:hypothetical protein
MPTFFNSIKSAVSESSSTLGAIASGLNTVSKLSSIANNLSDPGRVLSAIRSFNLPNGGESTNTSNIVSANWQGDIENDWRATLKILDASFFDNSKILEPIKNAGGLIFPYTPTISIGSSVSYSDQNMTHSNYQFTAYQSSRTNEIQVIGDFPVEDSDQGAYWLAVLHFLRSVTKMYTGNVGDSNPGNPPPVLNFSAYGDFVFKNIPVVVTNFSVSLPKEVDYIAVNPLVTSSITGSSTSTSYGNQADGLARLANLTSGALSAIGQTNAAGLVRVGAGILGAFDSFNRTTVTNVTGTSSSANAVGSSHVPTNSSISVTLKPIYSREKIRNFSLNTFISGGYVGQGYL